MKNLLGLQDRRIVQSLVYFSIAMKKRSEHWTAELSKNGEIFEKQTFTSEEAAIRWSEQLRFADHYVVTIYQSRHPDSRLSYICDRDPHSVDLTGSLFVRFK